MIDPTPAQIRKMCRAIRSTWSDAVRRERLGYGGRRRVRVPRVIELGEWLRDL